MASTFFPNPQTYYLATGQNFPDALGAGPAAAYGNGPVLLVKGSAATLDSATYATIDAKPVTFPVQIAGGTGTVSQGIDNQLASLTHDHRRRAGVDRYATAARISEMTFPGSRTVFLATGANFPDALAGVSAAGAIDAPILLVRQNCIPAAAMDQLERLRPNLVYLLGGSGALGSGVANLTECTS